ncbi:MAG: sensor histidine kinase [Candidatus Eremiobacteraeota bacterium]|nr:sensor histidine kinase [Candidatus Eremiobacteraeota bacterium]MBV9409639.1 sensor histidine kinase [Candidatus Eremiobacteraeota bacterium]
MTFAAFALLFSALAFVRPRGRTAIRVYLCGQLLALAAAAAFSALAGYLVVVLLARWLRYAVDCRAALAAAFLAGTGGIVAETCLTGALVEHRPLTAEALAFASLDVYAFLVLLVAVLRDARGARAVAALAERRRIARDLHDEVGHGLATLAAQLEAAERVRSTAPERADQLVEKARGSAVAALAAVRNTVATLREEFVVSGDLGGALRRLADDVAPFVGVPVEVRVTGPAVRDPFVVTNVARIAREALINVGRHSGASKALVLLDAHDGEFMLRIEDDGIGIDAPGGGNGLAIMRERAETLGGTLTLGHGPSGGTALHLVAPLGETTFRTQAR